MTAIEEIKGNSNINVYPNPANNFIIIENNNLVENKRISIINQQCQLLFQQKMQQNKEEINISFLANGVYFIKIEDNEGIVIKKIIKE